MTDKDLVKMPPDRVRQDEELMKRYIETYAAFFNKKPNCVSCGFKQDFAKLRKRVLKEKQETMRDYKIKPKYNSKILAYKEGKRTVRSYGRNASDEFLANFLEKGLRPESIEKREKMFAKVPKQSKPIEKMTRKELNAYAEKIGIDPKEYGKKDELLEAVING